jgi:hypothetical protein
VNILVLGHSAKPGSWDIRGKQLGAALGARVTSTPSPDDWRWADLCIVVKRSEPRFGPDARAAGVPIVWDALDCWRQPAENGLDEVAARQTLAAHLRVIRPALTIGATQAQADAACGVYLPHHSRPGLEPAPARERVEVVAYEGNAAYLGRWLETVSLACAKRGWRFVVNPPDLREADILVALRDGPWDGWMCREWKSGVKLVNAIAAGRPVITQHSAAVREIQPPGSVIETAADLEQALDSWAPLDWRAQAVADGRDLAPRYRLDRIAEDYRRIVAQVGSICAA